MLRQSGIVKYRKEGKEVYYTLDDEHVKQVFEVGIEHIEHKEKENKWKMEDFIMKKKGVKIIIALILYIIAMIIKFPN